MSSTSKPAPILSRPPETAEHFKISHMTLIRWRSQEGFPQPLKNKRVVLYDIAAIERWLATGNQQ